MTDRSHNQSHAQFSIAFAASLGLLAFIVIITIVFIPGRFIFPRLGFGGQAKDGTPPALTFFLRIDGRSVNRGDEVIRVKPGTEIVPVLTATDDQDSRPRGFVQFNYDQKFVDSGSRSTVLPGGPVAPNAPMILRAQGYYSFFATAKDNSGNVSSSRVITVLVQDDAAVVVSQIVADVRSSGVAELKVEVTLAANSFDVSRIYPSHLSLWPVDKDGRWLWNGDRGRMAVIGAYDRVARKATPETAAAVYHQDEGYWTLQFHGDFHEEPLLQMPEWFEITGTGWNAQTKEYFRFSTGPFTAESSSDPLETLKKKLGVLVQPTGPDQPPDN